MESGLVTEKELYASLQAQNLMREKLLTREQALEVLRRIRSHGDSFVNNLMAVGCTIEPIVFGVTLGRLFIDAGVITSQMLDEAMETSLLSGLPLVRVLVLHQSLTERWCLCRVARQVFLLLKEKRIGRDQAAGLSKPSSMHNEQIEEIPGIWWPQSAIAPKTWCAWVNLLVISGADIGSLICSHVLSAHFERSKAIGADTCGRRHRLRANGQLCPARPKVYTRRHGGRCQSRTDAA